MKRIIYTQEDGSVAIVIPAQEAIDGIMYWGYTYDEAISAIAQKDCPSVLEYKIVDTADMPTDRTFRNAWVKDGRVKGGIKTDITKAKLIAHDKRRIKRDEELKPFDDIIAKQIPGKNASEAEGSRQIIRNKHALIQSNIDSATTEAELLTQMELLK